MQGTTHRIFGVIARGRERQFTGTSLRVCLLILTTLTTLTLATLAGLFLSPNTPSASAAQSVPYKLNFQGRLTTSSGTVVADGLYNMQFKLYDTSTAGTLLWSETRETTNRVQVTNGLFSVQLGDVTALSPSLFNNASARYFEITQATPATANCSTASCATWESPMSPRQPMGAAAYAMNADLLDGLDSTAFAAASGSANYIQNQTASPQNASFNLSGDGTLQNLSVNGTLYAADTATFDGSLYANNDTFLGYAEVSQLAVTYSMSVANTVASAVIIQDASSNVLLNADTTNMKLSIGTATNSTARLNILGQANTTTWTARTDTQADQWLSVTYGNGLYVAVGNTGHVMTSPDGSAWTDRASPLSGAVNSVTYGNGLFVAVGNSGGVMTSLNGITWTARTAAQANNWSSVTYGNGLFVAVSDGQTNQVMTSPNGTTWTSATATESPHWTSITYGNGLFVAVNADGTNQVMTSPNGSTWTARTAAQANLWTSITYGNGLFVAVSQAGTSRVMTSYDGVTWTARTAAQANSWNAVTYGAGQFVAVSADGTSRVMTSYDGVTWTARTAAQANSWNAVTYGAGQFVAVSADGTKRVMTSGMEAITTTGDVTVSGAVQVKTNSTTAFQVQNAVGANLLTADTTNMVLAVGGNAYATGDIARAEAVATASDATQYSTTLTSYTTVNTLTASITGDRVVKGVYWRGELRHSTSTNDASLQLVCGTDQQTVIGSKSTTVTSTGVFFTISPNQVPASCYGYNGNISIQVQLKNESSGTAYVLNQSLQVQYMPLANYLKVATASDATQYSTTLTSYTTVNTLTASITGDRVVKGVYWRGELRHSTSTNDASLQLVCGTDQQTVIGSKSTTVTSTGIFFTISPNQVPASCYGYNGNISIQVQLKNESSGTAYVLNQSLQVLYTNGVVSLVGDGVGGSSGAASVSTTASGTPFTTPTYPDGIISTPVHGSGSYTVPSGKTLYITSVYNSSAVTAYTVGSGVRVAAMTGVQLPTPLAFASGEQPSVTGSGNIGFDGYLTATGVTPVHGSGSYTVPSGKILYIASVYNQNTTNAYTVGSGVRVAAQTSVQLPAPAVFAAGEQPSVSGGGSIGFDGYLTKADGSGGADVAEQYFIVGGGEAGDIVSIDSTSGADNPAVSKSTASYDRQMIAVISTKPGLTLGDETTAGKDGVMAIALNGRVPVKVNGEGGCIAVGDAITSSSTPGEGMKAEAAGRIVGYALSSYCGEGQGTVTVFINPGYQAHASNGVQDTNGMFTDLNVSGNATIMALQVTGDAHIGGNLLVVGTARFQGDIYVAGHWMSKGAKPQITNIDTMSFGLVADVDGTDTAGTITFKTGSQTVRAGELAVVTFAKQFDSSFRAILAPTNDASGAIRVHIVKQADGFKIISNDPLAPNTQYEFDYIVMGSKSTP